MPEWPQPTHGPNGSQPYTTVKDALEFLRSPAAQNFPNMKLPEVKAFDPAQGHVRLPKNDLAPAVKCSGDVFHYDEDRLLSVRERATLQSYPLDYEFHGSPKEKEKQAGNSNPVRFSAAIARFIRQSLRYLYVDELTEAQEATATDGADEGAPMDLDDVVEPSTKSDKGFETSQEGGSTNAETENEEVATNAESASCKHAQMEP